MFGLIWLYFLFNLHNIVIECLIPGISSELSVKILDQRVIDRKRQDTMDMCRIFTEETEKLEKSNQLNEGDRTEEYNPNEHRRSKRALPQKVINPMLTIDDAQRVENIVDKLYDDLLEKGEKINYRRMDVKELEKTGAIVTKLSEPGRRFNYAPWSMTGDKPGDDDDIGQHPGRGDTGPPPPLPLGLSPQFAMSMVPYFINRQTYDSYLAETIVKAFDYFERATCIRFQRLHERPTDEKSLENVKWIYITNPNGIRQCVHSNEKKLASGVQMVTLGYDCMSRGDILHEIMHVLGFSHEHTRNDRDKYISILWHNIKPGYKKYFESSYSPYAGLDNLPYDYASVMHYPPRAFSKNGQLTIMAQPGFKIGQREALSEIDIQKINMVYSGECVKRNRQYLASTCPSVVKDTPKTQKPTTKEIEDYFKDRIWPHGIVHYQFKDVMEFSHDEQENIKAVIRHIETETCLHFIDETPKKKEDGNYKKLNLAKKIEEVHPESDPEDADNEIMTDDISDSDGAPLRNSKKFKRKNTSIGVKDSKSRPRMNSLRTSNSSASVNYNGNAPTSPTRRRYIADKIILKRSSLPGCPCPKDLAVSNDSEVMVEINVDCFNTVNNLLHVFVHLLGLDHQHNSHDRDSYIHIEWEKLTSDVKSDLEKKLPAAASAGFDYDYQSVMHYPWMKIKDGRTNMIYPIWNDGWAMGNWQGLSSVDVQKINLLYSNQCASRKENLMLRNSHIK